MDWEETKESARRLVALVEVSHPHVYIKIVKDLISVNEWKVAMECLCDNLAEDPKPLSKELFDELREVATAIGLDRQYWDTLKVE